MDRFEEEGATLMAPLREAKPDLRSGVDVAKAVRTGRRRGRQRVVAGMVAVAVLTVLPVLVIPSLLHVGPHDFVSPPASGQNVAPSQFEASRRAVKVGSAGGYTPSHYSTGLFKQVIQLKRADGRAGGGEVAVYARGRSPVIDTSPKQKAANVNTRRAYWVPNEANPTLAVNWADGDAWSIIRVFGTDADLLDRAHHVAQSVSYFESTPATVPFTLPARKSGDPLRLVSLSSNVEGNLTGLQLATGDNPDQPPHVTVSVFDDKFVDDTPNAQIGGRDAYVGRKEVRILDLNGYGVEVGTDELAALGGIEKLKEIAGSVQLVQNPADRSNWVSTPWRA